MQFSTGIKVLRMIGRPHGASLYEIASALDVSYRKARGIVKALGCEFDVYTLDCYATDPRDERYFLGYEDKLESGILSCSRHDCDDVFDPDYWA